MANPNDQVLVDDILDTHFMDRPRECHAMAMDPEFRAGVMTLRSFLCEMVEAARLNGADYEVTLKMVRFMVEKQVVYRNIDLMM